MRCKAFDAILIRMWLDELVVDCSVAEGGVLHHIEPYNKLTMTLFSQHRWFDHSIDKAKVMRDSTGVVSLIKCGFGDLHTQTVHVVHSL